MKYCKKCVQPDTRPNIRFSDDGVCPACQYIEQLKDVDWDERDRQLEKIVEFGRKNNVSGYDCIIGVSGGKDSLRQSMYVKDQLGLKALLVSCTYPPEQQTERGAYNMADLIGLGFDAINVSPNPQIWKKLMREGFFKYGNWCKGTEMTLYACLPKIAFAYHIPLIFLGENPATHFGELGVGSLDWNANGVNRSNTIAVGPDIFLSDEIKEKDLFWYRYPSEEETQWANMQVVYLGYFWKDFTKVDNGNFSVSYGLDLREGNPYERGNIHPFDALDDDFVVINQMMKRLKYGFGKASDEICEEIRYGRMTREKGVEMVKKYDGGCSPQYIQRFCDYLKISEEQFWEVIEKYRNPDIWVKDKNNNWQLKYPVGYPWI